uniref:Uncharacterized protein n=1 Tax=Pseudonaja textilis TaxID=8673 RepID=A0A670ZQM8_PSETE
MEDYIFWERGMSSPLGDCDDPGYGTKATQIISRSPFISSNFPPNVLVTFYFSNFDRRAMELQHIVQKLRRELTCSICFKSFFNPITLACGHNFCHACLVSYWGQFPIETACPRCQVKIPRLNFIPNVQLANITKLSEPVHGRGKQAHTDACIPFSAPSPHSIRKAKKVELYYKVLKRDDLRQLCFFVANVTLDPDTAHPKLILSEDLKRCWLGRKSQNLVNDDKRFDLMPCVLGRKMFVTGRHYWDVAVENEGDWAVGVARSSMKRKGIEAFRNMEGIWAMAKCCGRFWVYMNPPVLVSDPMRWKIKKIRVSLNYAGGRVAFCDIERGNLLHAFSLTSYFGEPIHPFFWIGRKTRLSLCP